MNMMKEVTPAQAYMVGMLYAAFEKHRDGFLFHKE
jgi:hypothetical protein